jgi:hypothetical protein
MAITYTWTITQLDCYPSYAEQADASGFRKTLSDGVPSKAIYQTDLQYAIMKALQKAVAKIDALETEVTALKAKVGA